VPITLNSVEFNDNYEGGMEQRIIICSMNFKIKIDIYPAIEGVDQTACGEQEDAKGLIRWVRVDAHTGMEATAPGSIVETTLDPGNANPDDEYKIITTIKGFD